MDKQVKGLVLRTVDIKESDRLLTIFTEEEGAITAVARGSRQLKSRKMSSTMQFCYSSFVLYGHGDKYWVREAELIESFYDIRSSIDGLALANYIAEVLSDVTVAEAERDLLRLSLNSLYAISEKKYSLEKIKAAFEIRALSIIGFMPEVLSCRECGETAGDFFLDVMGGNLECYACHQRLMRETGGAVDDGERRVVTILSEGAKVALGYLVHSPLERIFAFNISDDDMHLLSRATEEYLLNQLERTFKSLEFYKEVKR